VLDFRIDTSSGYETEEYISPATDAPITGRVLNGEDGGFAGTAPVVFSAETGGLLDEENFKHFLEKRVPIRISSRPFSRDARLRDNLRGVFLPQSPQKRWFYEF